MWLTRTMLPQNLIERRRATQALIKGHHLGRLWPIYGGLLLLACSGAQPSSRVHQSPPSVSGSSEQSSVTAPAAVDDARSTETPVLAAPLAGLTEADTAEARLIKTSCEGREPASQRWARAKRAEMRQALAESFNNWQKQQPGCWASYRSEEEYWKNQHKYPMFSATPSPLPLGWGENVANNDAFVETAPEDFSPNLQVEGVDEADIAKTDGKSLFIASNGALRVVDVERPRVLATVSFRGIPKGLFLTNNRVVLLVATGQRARNQCTYAYDCRISGDGTGTNVLVLDVTARTLPRLTRKLELSSSLVDSRRIGNMIHLVLASPAEDEEPRLELALPKSMPTCGTTEHAVRSRINAMISRNDFLIAQAAKQRQPTLHSDGQRVSLCREVFASRFDSLIEGENGTTRLPEAQPVLSLVSFDLDQPRIAPTYVSIGARAGAVFASERYLYVGVRHDKSKNRRWPAAAEDLPELTEVHRFQLARKDAELEYLGSGIVPGHPLSQYAMDEWHGDLRIATTTGRAAVPPVVNQVTILRGTPSGNLLRVGGIDELARGEDFRAIRFEGDKGYLVTFKRTDPLFVVDLKAPEAPKVLGVLSIPGFSTQLFRIRPDRMLGLGFDSEDGNGTRVGGLLVQYFDTSNPERPKLLNRFTAGERGSVSTAMVDPRALAWNPRANILALPATACVHRRIGCGGFDDRCIKTSELILQYDGLLILLVNEERTWLRSLIQHDPSGAHCQGWWSEGRSTVLRARFVNERLFSIAEDHLMYLDRPYNVRSNDVPRVALGRPIRKPTPSEPVRRD